jgi:hypothetical protein
MVYIVAMSARPLFQSMAARIELRSLKFDATVELRVAFLRYDLTML